MSRNPSRATARRAPVGAGASHPSARPLRPALAALVAALLSVGVGIGLVGCVPGPDASPSPTATAAGPRFASDEEALAAAEEAYAAYLAMSDRIAQDGGRDPERIAEFVTEEQLARELEIYKLLSSSGAHQIGSTAVDGFRLHGWGSAETKPVAIQIEACLDFSGTLVELADGSAAQHGRTSDRVRVEVELSVEEDAQQLRIASVGQSSRDDEC